MSRIDIKVTVCFLSSSDNVLLLFLNIYLYILAKLFSFCIKWEYFVWPLDQIINPKRNQSWIFTGRTNAEAETLLLWPPDVKSNSWEKTLVLGKIEGRRKRGPQRKRWLHGITNSTGMSLSELWEGPGQGRTGKSGNAAVHRIAKSRTGWSNWTDIVTFIRYIHIYASVLIYRPRAGQVSIYPGGGVRLSGGSQCMSIPALVHWGQLGLHVTSVLWSFLGWAESLGTLTRYLDEWW